MPQLASVFSAIKSVGDGFTLIAFILAIVAFLYYTRLNHAIAHERNRLDLIKSVPQVERVILVKAELENKRKYFLQVLVPLLMAFGIFGASASTIGRVAAAFIHEPVTPRALESKADPSAMSNQRSTEQAGQALPTTPLPKLSGLITQKSRVDDNYNGPQQTGFSSPLRTPGAALRCTSTNGLAVDADGAPDSYRIDGRGLSSTCDGVFAIVNGVAHTQENDPAHWQELCAEHWADAQASGDYSRVKVVGFLTDKNKRPIIQSADDPLPGKAFVTTNTLSIPGTPPFAQRHFTNARDIPYVVLPRTYAVRHSLKPGDLVALYRPRTDKVAYGVYGDCCSLGEASIRLHQDLGNDPLVTEADGTVRAKRGIPDHILWVALTGTHTHPTLDPVAWRAEIKIKGDAALSALGGVATVKACKPD